MPNGSAARTPDNAVLPKIDHVFVIGDERSMKNSAKYALNFFFLCRHYRDIMLRFVAFARHNVQTHLSPSHVRNARRRWLKCKSSEADLALAIWLSIAPCGFGDLVPRQESLAERGPSSGSSSVPCD